MNSRKLRLGVNIDHVATLREARGEAEPSPLRAAVEAAKAGADGITVHLREDRRHIQDRDVFLLKHVIHVPLNLEMSLAPEIVAIALRLRPAKVCLVPEKRRELTTEGGLAVSRELGRIERVVRQLSKRRIDVSLFIAPERHQIQAATESGASTIEHHTGEYANAVSAQKEFERLKKAADFAHSLGLKVNAGHGLNYQNVTAMTRLPYLEELNIGHSIVARAVFVGMKQAVKEMKTKLCTKK